jgi:hypothetical protein
MSKKITDEKYQSTSKNKPFYKRVWLWIVVLLVVVVGATAANSKSDESGEKSTNHSSKSTGKKTISESEFNALKVGAMESNGTGGESYNDIVSKFGKPNSTSKSTVQGMAVEMDTWTNLGGDYTSVSLSFGGSDDAKMLTSKSYTNAKNILSSKKISQSDYDSINTDGNTKIEDIISKFGKPATYTVMSVMGIETKTAVWSNVDSSVGKEMSLTISGGNTIIQKAN